MKERPILFNSEMVNATLDDRKTQTRRVIKPQPNNNGWLIKGQSSTNLIDCPKDVLWSLCPYGKPGDRLWVRETFAIECNDGFQDVYGEPKNPLGTVRWDKDGENCEYFECARYRASEPETILGDDEDGMKWKPSIYMPRWASRITLEITDVRVERLQEISGEDILDEGLPGVVQNDELGNELDEWETITQFEKLWNSIHKKENTWKDDPWVWVVAFKKL